MKMVHLDKTICSSYNKNKNSFRGVGWHEQVLIRKQ